MKKTDFTTAYLITAMIFTTIVLCPLMITFSQSPSFSIEIEPAETTAQAGDDLTYDITIDASGGFNESITFVLEVTALSYGITLDVGTYHPPYPKTFTYTFTLPSDIPIAVDAEATLTGTSLSDVQSETVKITIQKSGSGGGILGWLISTLTSIWNRIISIFNR